MSYLPQKAIRPLAFDTSVVNLTAVATTNVVNVSTTKGALWFIGLEIKTLVAGGNTTCALQIQVDGATQASYTVINAGTIFEPEIQTLPGSGTGAMVGDVRQFLFFVPFRSSLRVSLDVSASTAAAGELRVVVIRGTEL